jgi:hypothetical protein
MIFLNISFVFLILTLVFIFKALRNIKIIKNSLNNGNLEVFYIKISSAITRGFIAMVSLVAGGLFLAFGINSVMTNIISIIIGANLLLLGIVMTVSTFATEKNAWENLKEFLEENRELFPETIINEVIEGTEHLKTAAILHCLFMFGITLFIGFIFRLIGYFKLTKLNNLDIYIPQEIILKQEVASGPTTSTVLLQSKPEDINFCPMCASRDYKQGNYCPECGSQLYS